MANAKKYCLELRESAQHWQWTIFEVSSGRAAMAWSKEFPTRDLAETDGTRSLDLLNDQNVG